MIRQDRGRDYARIAGHSNAGDFHHPTTGAQARNISQFDSTGSDHDDGQQQYGIPGTKSRMNWPDLLAVSVSLVCFGVGGLILHNYAADLGYRNQIIVLGVLLGVMSQCSSRMMPYMFLLLESKLGGSRLQSYEGLLRWSPFVSKLHFVWRGLIIILLSLPIALGVLYKRYPEVPAVFSNDGSNATFGPAAPPGLQAGVGTNAILANATIPFLSLSADDNNFPESLPQHYGFNLVLLSNESAAALDAPSVETVAALQQSLRATESYELYAEVRGTVTRYNRTNEQLRETADGYWEPIYEHNEWQYQNYFNGFCFGLMQKDVARSNDPEEFDCSYTVVGYSPCDGDPNMAQVTDSFEKTSLRFDARRHACLGAWRITRQSIELINGTCDTDPLPEVYQYYKNSQMSVTSSVSSVKNLLSNALFPVLTTRNQSQWLFPIHATVLASSFQSIIAYQRGHVNIQVNGTIWTALGLPYDAYFVESYEGRQRLLKYVSIVRVHWSLYVILAIHPILTLLAYLSTWILFSTPISRSFGFVSLMAGIDRKSLDLLQGAGLSGELSAPVKLRIVVQRPAHGNGRRRSNSASHPSAKIVYRVGDSRRDGKVRSKVEYT